MFILWGIKFDENIFFRIIYNFIKVFCNYNLIEEKIFKVLIFMFLFFLIKEKFRVEVLI